MSVNNTIYFTQYIGFYIIHIKGTDHEYTYMFKIFCGKKYVKPKYLFVFGYFIFMYRNINTIFKGVVYFRKVYCKYELHMTCI